MVTAYHKRTTVLEFGVHTTTSQQLWITTMTTISTLWGEDGPAYRRDILVNNATMAYERVDPTIFKRQCQPALDVNFRGTADLTDKLLAFWPVQAVTLELSIYAPCQVISVKQYQHSFNRNSRS